MVATLKRTLTVFAVLFVLVSGASGMVAAQEATPTTPTNATNTSTSDESDVTYRGQVGSSARIVSVDWDGCEATVVIESDLPQGIALTDVSGQSSDASESGVHEYTTTRKNIARGQTEITYTATEYENGCAIGIGASGGGVTISTGYDDDGDNPLSYLPSTQAWISGAITALTMMIIAGLREKAKEDGKPKSGFRT
jgi:hypothetical protein